MIKVNCKNFILFNNNHLLGQFLLESLFLEQKKKLNIIISGGNSLKPLLKKLNLNKIHKNINLILSDERLVNYSSKYSNTRVINNLIYNKKGNNFINNFLTIPMDAKNISDKYLCRIMDDRYKSIKKDTNIGIFGIGSDGHFASIFNNKSLISGNYYFINKNSNESFKRISLKFSVIKNIKTLYFVINSRNKNKILKTIINDNQNRKKLPIIQLLKERKNNQKTFFLVTKNSYIKKGIFNEK